MPINTLLKKARLHQGLTAGEVAEAVGFSENMWYKIESGERHLAIDYMPDVCKILKLSYSDLLGEIFSADSSNDIAKNEETKKLLNMSQQEFAEHFNLSAVVDIPHWVQDIDNPPSYIQGINIENDFGIKHVVTMDCNTFFWHAIWIIKSLVQKALNENQINTENSRLVDLYIEHPDGLTEKIRKIPPIERSIEYVSFESIGDWLPKYHDIETCGLRCMIMSTKEYIQIDIRHNEICICVCDKTSYVTNSANFINYTVYEWNDYSDHGFWLSVFYNILRDILEFGVYSLDNSRGWASAKNALLHYLENSVCFEYVNIRRMEYVLRRGLCEAINQVYSLPERCYMRNNLEMATDRWSTSMYNNVLQRVCENFFEILRDKDLLTECIVSEYLRQCPKQDGVPELTDSEVAELPHDDFMKLVEKIREHKIAWENTCNTKIESAEYKQRLDIVLNKIYDVRKALLALSCMDFESIL